MGGAVRVLMVFALAGCGAAVPASRAAAPRIEAAAPEPLSLRRQGVIDRALLDETLSEGLGRFLGGLETTPHLSEGQFVGFRIVNLRSPLFEGIDLRPGDTVLSINGQSIERPMSAMRVWESLAVASELTVEYLRDGEPGQLRFEIRD